MLLLTDLDNTVIFSHRHEVIGKKIWVETLNGNHNILAHINEADILDKILNTRVSDQKENYYGNGDAAEKLCSIIFSEGNHE